MSTQVSGDSEINIHRTGLLLTCTAICLAECTTDGHWTTKPFSKRCNMYQLFFSSLGPNAWQKQLKRRDNYLTHGLMAWGPFRSSTSWLVVNYLVARKKTGGKPEVLLLSLRIHTPHNCTLSTTGGYTFNTWSLEEHSISKLQQKSIKRYFTARETCLIQRLENSMCSAWRKR